MAVRWRNIFTLSVSFLYLLNLSFGFITENHSDINNSLISCVVSHIQNTESNKYTYGLGAQLNIQKNLSTYNVKLNIFAKCRNEIDCVDKTLICISNVQELNGACNVLELTCEEGNKDEASSSTASEEASPNQTMPKEPCQPVPKETSSNPDEPEKELPRNEVVAESFGLEGSTEPVPASGEPDSESIEKTTVQLVHEVQPTNTETSGEQFVAIRRKELGPGCSGCASQVDLNAPGVHELAVSAVKHIDRHQRDEKHSLVEILSVQRQVQIVSGVRYILYLNVDFNSCDKDYADASNCSEIKLCKISILEKPWLKLSDGSRFRAVISNNCTDEYFFMENEFLPPINNLPKIMEHAIEKSKSDQTLPDYDMISNTGKTEDILKVVKNTDLQASSRDNNKLSDDRLKSLEEQIIDGFKSNIEVSRPKKPNKDLKKLLADFDAQFTKINHENAKNNEIPSTESLNEYQENNDSVVSYIDRKIRTWDRPWIPDRQVTIEEVSHRNRRSTAQQKKGAPKNIPISDNIRDIAHEGLQKLEGESNSLYRQKVIRVKSATRQTVAGSLTKVYFEVGLTQCLKSEIEKNLANCQLQETSETVEYVAEVWSRPWLNERQVTVKQSADRKKRGVPDERPLLGGAADVPVNDEMRKIAQEGLNSIEAKSNSLYRQKVLRVTSATKQVVAGSLTKVFFEVGLTQCLKSDNVENLEACQLQEKSEPVKYVAEVWSRPWLKERKLTVKQSTDRKKRGLIDVPNLPGGESSIPIDDKIEAIAHEGLEKLEGKSNSLYKQKVIRVQYATTQIVSGSLTRVCIEVGLTECLKSDDVENLEVCQLQETSEPMEYIVEVWDRPWLPDRQVTVHAKTARSKREVDDVTFTQSLNKLELSNSNKLSKRKSDSRHRDWNNNLSSTVFELAKHSLKHIEVKYPHSYKQEITNILSVKHTNHSGTQYEIQFEVGFTDCTVLDATSVCNLTNSVGPRKQCKSIVKPKADGTRRVHVTCHLEDDRAESVHLSNLVKAGRLFRQFLSKHNRDYVDNRKEMYIRFNIFRANLDIIDQLNLNEQGTATYGVNHFADVSPTEFRNKYLGLRPDLKDYNAIPMRNAEIPNIEVPKAFDWRDEGAVTEVKNQGICGSCWAFSVTGNIEGQWKIKKGKLVSLSEQELVDCDKLDEGCNGGLPDNAYRAIEQLGGLETEKDYPYEGDDEKCHFNKTLSRVQISGAVNISSNESDMVKWLAQNGPISIGINANAMQFYMGGISHPWKILCNPKNLDHGVLIVGYGVTSYPLFNKTMPFWTIKNSWGDSWGENGYYRVFRGDGTCGVNNMASSAVV